MYETDIFSDLVPPPPKAPITHPCYGHHTHAGPPSLTLGSAHSVGKNRAASQIYANCPHSVGAPDPDPGGDGAWGSRTALFVWGGGDLESFMPRSGTRVLTPEPHPGLDNQIAKECQRGLCWEIRLGPDLGSPLQVPRQQAIPPSMPQDLQRQQHPRHRQTWLHPTVPCKTGPGAGTNCPALQKRQQAGPLYTLTSPMVLRPPV